MTEFVKNILFIYPNLVIFLPLILAVSNYKKYPPELRHITTYMALSVATQIMSFALWKLKKNNFPILHAYTLVEYYVLLRYYMQILKGFIPKSALTVIMYLFLVYSVIDSLFIESIFTFNTYSRSVEALILITLAVCWFVKIVGEEEEERTGTSGLYYINSGFMVYFAGSLILFSYGSYVEKMAIATRINLWTIHTFLAAQLYILITIGLWKARAR